MEFKELVYLKVSVLIGKYFQNFGNLRKWSGIRYVIADKGYDDFDVRILIRYDA
jgi:hypothetical protein